MRKKHWSELLKVNSDGKRVPRKLKKKIKKLIEKEALDWLKSIDIP